MISYNRKDSLVVILIHSRFKRSKNNGPFDQLKHYVVHYDMWNGKI